MHADVQFKKIIIMGIILIILERIASTVKHFLPKQLKTSNNSQRITIMFKLLVKQIKKSGSPGPTHGTPDAEIKESLAMTMTEKFPDEDRMNFIPHEVAEDESTSIEDESRLELSDDEIDEVFVSFIVRFFP